MIPFPPPPRQDEPSGPKSSERNNFSWELFIMYLGFIVGGIACWDGGRLILPHSRIHDIPPGMGPFIGTLCLIVGFWGAWVELWKDPKGTSPHTLSCFVRKAALAGMALGAGASLAVGWLLSRAPSAGQLGTFLLLGGLVGGVAGVLCALLELRFRADLDLYDDPKSYARFVGPLAGASLALLLSFGRSPAPDRPPAQPRTERDLYSPPPGAENLPYPLPREVVEAWEKAGAVKGWMRLRVIGFDHVPAWQGGEGGDLPAFRLFDWQEGVVTKLPAPAVPFGLYLFDSWDASRDASRLTDAGLKELAGLKSLRWLALINTQVTGTGLKELAGLKGLQGLDLRGTRVTDAGLKELAGLKRLQTLDLGGLTIDAGLKELAALTSLQRLDLACAEVTDKGLKELAGLKGLQWLNLNSTKVTDQGLKELAGLTGLRELNLGNTRVTDRGLKELAGLKRLQTLLLSSTQVTDKGLKALAGLTSLEELYLDGNQVTDESVKELAGLKGLRTLRIVGPTRATDAGIRGLRQALPNCTIHCLRR
jgi:internalin A